MYYFASDMHLGHGDAPSARHREKLLVQWLDHAAKDATAIFLLGDVFDFWFEYKQVVPKGFVPKFEVPKMCRAYHNNYLQCRALLTLRGAKFEDMGEAVLARSQRAEFPRFLSQINIVEYSSLEDVQSWLLANDGLLQCVVSEIDGLHSRQVSLGRAQRPTLFDYADERDTMQFLASVD